MSLASVSRKVDPLRVFLSHSHKDNGWCDGFVEELKNNNLDVWYDREGLYIGSQSNMRIALVIKGITHTRSGSMQQAKIQ